MEYIVASTKDKATEYASEIGLDDESWKFVANAVMLNDVPGRLHGLRVASSGYDRKDFNKIIASAVKAGFDW